MVRHDQFEQQRAAFRICVDEPAEVWKVVLVGGEVENAVDAFQCMGQVHGVGNIASDELGIGWHPGWLALGVHSRLQIVEDSYAVAAFEEQVHGVGADETSSASNEDSISASE